MEAGALALAPTPAGSDAHSILLEPPQVPLDDARRRRHDFDEHESVESFSEPIELIGREGGGDVHEVALARYA